MDGPPWSRRGVGVVQDNCLVLRNDTGIYTRLGKGWVCWWEPPFEGVRDGIGIYSGLGKGWCGLMGAPFGLGGALRWSRTIVDGVQDGAGISTGLGREWLELWVLGRDGDWDSPGRLLRGCGMGPGFMHG